MPFGTANIAGPIATAVITEASIEPVTLAETILFSRGNIGFEDALFNAFITTDLHQSSFSSLKTAVILVTKSNRIYPPA